MADAHNFNFGSLLYRIALNTIITIEAFMMIQLTYLSTPTRTMSNDDLMDILKKARLNNAGLGISGMLLYTGEVFVQVLEGEENVVDDLVKLIKIDPRHKDFRIIERKKLILANTQNGRWGSKESKKMICVTFLG